MRFFRLSGRHLVQFFTLWKNLQTLFAPIKTNSSLTTAQISNLNKVEQQRLMVEQLKREAQVTRISVSQVSDCDLTFDIGIGNLHLYWMLKQFKWQEFLSPMYWMFILVSVYVLVLVVILVSENCICIAFWSNSSDKNYYLPGIEYLLQLLALIVYYIRHAYTGP